MRRYLALCFVLSLAACGGAADKPPPVPADASAPDAATVDQGDVGFVQGLDAAYQDPGLTRADGGVAYPAGPYGTRIGGIVQNISLYGYPEGALNDGKNNLWSTVQVSDFYDPDGSKKNSAGAPYKTLFVNVSARWCSVCQAEAGGLEALCAKYAPQGMGCYTAIFENLDSDPATRDDVNFWMNAYGLDFPICADPDFEWGTFFNKDATPLNMFVDLKTMKIIDRVTGVPPDGWDPYFNEYSACATSICPDGGI